jgi:SSS family solute:Na+ symporter
MNSSQIIILLFGILYFAVVVLTRKKGDFEEFSVAGRGLGTFLIFCTLSASYIGPAFTLGLTRDGFNNGMFLACLAPMAGIGLLFVGIFLAPRIKSKFVESFSIGDIVGGVNSHNHKFVRILVGIINLIFLSSVVVAMSYAGGELVNNVFGISKFWAIALMTTIVTIYSFYGGIRATIQTDAVQFIHFVLLIPLLALLMILSERFDWTSYSSHTVVNSGLAFDSSSFSRMMGIAFLYLLSQNGLDGPGINRFLAAKNTKVAKRAAIGAGVFIALWIVLMIFIGTMAAYLHPEMGDNDQILLFVAEKYFPGVFYGIFIIAMVGVVMSTQDTLINGAGISFSQDILEGINPKITDEQKLFYSKAYTVFLGIVAIGIASFLDAILSVIIAQFEYYVPVMVPIVVFSIVKKQHHWQSAIAGMLGGVLSFQLWDNFGSSLIPTLVIGLSFNCIAYLISDAILNQRKSAEVHAG